MNDEIAIRKIIRDGFQCNPFREEDGEVQTLNNIRAHFIYLLVTFFTITLCISIKMATPCTPNVVVSLSSVTIGTK
jgi:hypothetical protein